MKRIPATTENIKGWDDIPLVKLGNILKQMVWFTGNYSLNRDEEAYEKYGLDSIPKTAHLYIQYRKKDITIICEWEEPNPHHFDDKEYHDKFVIGIESPFCTQFQIPRYRVEDQIIFKHTRFYSTAIDKIEDSILEAQEVIDERITEKENKKKREIELEVIRKNLCKNLDVSITKERYGNEAFTYREDLEYNLNFGSIDGTDLFQILEIGGEYTQDEIKKIIAIVGGNPRAIAERLTK